MVIRVTLQFSEVVATSLLNWLARINALQIRGNPKIPALYDSGVRYEREEVETWSDVLSTLAAGHEDCDALAAWRAGELMARGWKALRPGEGGYEAARQLRPTTIHAEVFLRTRLAPGETGGLYHCIVRYKVGSRWYYDDPSARLGMLPRDLGPRETQRRLAEQRRAVVPVRRPAPERGRAVLTSLVRRLASRSSA